MVTETRVRVPSHHSLAASRSIVVAVWGLEYQDGMLPYLGKEKDPGFCISGSFVSLRNQFREGWLSMRSQYELLGQNEIEEARFSFQKHVNQQLLN